MTRKDFNIDEWTSDGENHIITNITAGDYTLKEVAAPDGYIIATDICFTIEEYGNVTVDGVETVAFTEDGIPCITMVDEAEKVPTPVVPPTGDTGRNPFGYIMLIAGVIGISLSTYRYRKIAKEIDEFEGECAEFCPDFIEGDRNE